MFKMLIKESVNLFQVFFNFTIVFTKSFLQQFVQHIAYYSSGCFKLTHISESLFYNPNQIC